MCFEFVCMDACADRFVCVDVNSLCCGLLNAWLFICTSFLFLFLLVVILVDCLLDVVVVELLLFNSVA